MEPAMKYDIQSVYTASFHNFKSQNFKLSVSNPKSKYVAYLSVLSQISKCQGLGCKNKHEILKTDRNGNGFIGMVTALQQVYLAIYDTNAQPFVYTGSENIDITYNQISLNSPIKVNNEIVLNPRAYDNAVFEMISGT